MSWLAQPLLTTLAQARADLSVATLAAQVGRSRHDVSNALVVLHRRGLVERIALGVYRLSPAGQTVLDQGQPVRSGSTQRRTPRVWTGTLRHRVWKLLGERRKATLPDLLRLASTGQEREADSNIRHYLRLLERTGYLLRTHTRKPGTASTSPGHVQWIVVRWTGPRAPIARHHFTVAWDPNLQQEVTGHD